MPIKSIFQVIKIFKKKTDNSIIDIWLEKTFARLMITETINPLINLLTRFCREPLIWNFLFWGPLFFLVGHQKFVITYSQSSIIKG